jgi:hypothetical protein
VVAAKGSGGDAGGDSGAGNPYAKAPAEGGDDAGGSVDRKA